ncbi:hypothetical protein COCMIDRAFT_108565 [Bipolaris oryzae ATCC 44560]|uniref:Nucleoside phosphorylase domain-containing protein n=1 Tax=Bipolaris oryzae ATCC 44560 TaxID=930090 RepID=W6YMM4_COCMI|nr:uncharacterized protein COCMIDRAFT_108565 [Bipolaris oryzae ATCC 44560]EUC40537.1 hypothetical protein COCMIDRAFT_108565 [Bipolaris oryzae ATCC 44560]
MDATIRLAHDDYTVAWIVPLGVDSIAARLMLDTKHEKLPQSSIDHNVYELGSINGHNIVIASLPTTGNTSAATVVAQLRNTFKQIRFGLLVGTAGVPARTDNGPIHLGDVIVSKPERDHSGAIQYDHGKILEGHFRRTGYLIPPPTVLLNAAQDLSTEQAITEDDLVAPHLQRIDTRLLTLQRYRYPGPDRDNLYRSDYSHRVEGLPCHVCPCDPLQRIDRYANENQDDDFQYDRSSRIVVHRGTVAAGEKVIKDGRLRDELYKAHDALCFDMEAAGVMNDFPCLVIRGISNYADSHKSDDWQGYASASAAAYARQLFFHMPANEVKQCAVGLTGI